MDGGASYEMAWEFYKATEARGDYSYGMKTEKQADKGDYFLKHYNANGNITAKDIENWYLEAAGCSKKKEYLEAYMRAGATYSQALLFYKLMQGYDQSFNAWSKQNGG
jgi:hypothetical protein